MAGCGGCAYKGMSTAVEDTFVGVRFREETNPTLCATGGKLLGKGEQVVVDLEDGPAYGAVEVSPMPVFKPCQKSSARRILRRATQEDGESNRPPLFGLRQMSGCGTEDSHRRTVNPTLTSRRYCQVEVGPGKLAG